MKQSINNYCFHRAFEKQRPDNFTYDGLEALFNYFEDLEDDIGEEIELDVIAICCDYSELTLADLKSDYNIDADDMDEATEQLIQQTMVINVNDETVIIQQF